MMYIGGFVGLLWGWFVAFTGFLWGSTVGLFGFLWGSILALVERLSGPLPRRLVTSLVWVVGLLSGWVFVLGILGAAVILNALGVESVHTRLYRALDRDGSDDADREPVPDVSFERVTDDAGRFSPEAFEKVTGMAPPEFVHLYVKSKGGRIEQKHLNTCLPWSKSTVSRLLDSLEEDGVLVRVTVGRANVVCTPDSVPEHAL
jgi:hypothetical protein